MLFLHRCCQYLRGSLKRSLRLERQQDCGSAGRIREDQPHFTHVVKRTRNLPSIDAHGGTAVVQTLDRTTGRRLGHVAGILAGTILGH